VTKLQSLLNKLYYLFLRTSLYIGYLVVLFLRVIAPLIPKRRTKELLLFPDKQKGSDGYNRRFEEYFKYLNKDNISFDVADICDHDYVMQCLFESKKRGYRLYHFIFWKRIFQVLSARNYKAVFVHRQLFPYYPDQRKPYLEMLLHKLNKNITYDFWDTVYLQNPALINETLKFANKLSLVNQFLLDHFQGSFKGKQFIWPIAVNISRYKVKLDYDLGETVKFIWTGYPLDKRSITTKNTCKILSSVFEELSKNYTIELVVISREILPIRNIKIIHYQWSEHTFFTNLQNADIGLYPMFENIEIEKGRMAMKAMDFMCTGLPTIGSPYGLSPFVVENENFMFAQRQEEWVTGLKELLVKKQLREKIGKNAREMVEKHHNLEESYKQFKNMVLG